MALGGSHPSHEARRDAARREVKQLLRCRGLHCPPLQRRDLSTETWLLRREGEKDINRKKRLEFIQSLKAPK